MLAMALTGSANPITPNPLTRRGECGHCDIAFQECTPVSLLLPLNMIDTAVLI